MVAAGRGQCSCRVRFSGSTAGREATGPGQGEGRDNAVFLLVSNTVSFVAGMMFMLVIMLIIGSKMDR